MGNKNEFHSLSPNSTCCVTTRTSVRVALVVCVAPCLFQHVGRRRSSIARVYKCSISCSGFAWSSGTTSGKSEPPQSTLWWHPSTRVLQVALVVTTVSRRAVRQARRSTSRLFLMSKCMDYSVSVSRNLEFGYRDWVRPHNRQQVIQISGRFAKHEHMGTLSSQTEIGVCLVKAPETLASQALRQEMTRLITTRIVL